MNPIYQPNTLGHSILALVFYILMAGLMLYSLLALYALLKFGRNTILGIIIAILYLIFTASLYSAAVANLNQIKL